MSETNKFEIEKFIVCDDIRQENTKKLLFIGVYPDDIIYVDVFPYTNRSLAFFLMFKTKHFNNEKISVSLIDPKGEKIFEPDEPFEVKSKLFSFSASITNLILNDPGKYEIIIDINGQQKLTKEFHVKKK